MDIKTPLPQSSQNERKWAQKYMEAYEVTGSVNWLTWWYKVTAPPPPPPGASLPQREHARRSFLTSTILFAIALILLFALPIGIITNQPVITIALSFMMIVCIIALAFNRFGRTNIAGIILVVAVNLGFIAILNGGTSGKLSPNGLITFDLMIVIEVLTVSLLPPIWVFPVALFNIGYITWDILTHARTPEFALLMETKTYEIIARPIFLHVVVSFVLWLWVRSATQAIARADRAELIAQLQHTIATQEHEEAEQKRQLETSIQQIIDIHVRIANGDYSARVPLSSDNVLWQISGSLNNMISRLQRLRQFEQEMQGVLAILPELRYDQQYLKKLREELSQLLAAIQHAKEHKKPLNTLIASGELEQLTTEIKALVHSLS